MANYTAHYMGTMCYKGESNFAKYFFYFLCRSSLTQLSSFGSTVVHKGGYMSDTASFL